MAWYDKVNDLKDLFTESLTGFAHGSQSSAQTPGTPANQIYNSSSRKAEESYRSLFPTPTAAPAPAPAPKAQTVQPTSGGVVAGASTGGYSGGGFSGGGYSAPVGPSAAELQAAKDEAEAARLRSAIGKSITQAQAVYDSIFGSVDTIGQDRRDTLGEQFGEQRTDLTQEFASEVPRIGQAFASLGAGNSTFEDRALGTAQQGLNKGVRDLNRLEEQDLASIGQFIAQQKATVGADQDVLTRVSARLPNVTDLDELREYEDVIANALGKANVARAGLNTPQGFRGELNENTQGIAGAEGIRGAVMNILNSSVPAVVKEEAVQGIVASSGLSDDEKLNLLDIIETESALEA